MRSTGIVRNVDSVGRIVLPAELREVFGIKESGGQLEFFVDKDTIILKKFEPTCIFCGNEDDIIIYKDKKICKACAKQIGALE